MPKVTFQYEDGTSTIVDVTAGENLLEVARKANVAIDAPCSGNGSCGKCRVRYISGELESEQTRHITDEDYAAGWRLSCCSKVTGDVTVLVPDIASAYKSRMKVADLSSPEEVAIFDRAKQDVADAGITFENEFTVVELQMTAPSLDDTMPDNERLSWAIEAATGIENVKLTYQVLKKLPDALEEFLKNHPEIKEIEICTDNDFAGRWAKEQMKKHYEGTYQIICNLPEKEGADYADLAKEKKQANKCRDRPLERR